MLYREESTKACAEDFELKMIAQDKTIVIKKDLLFDFNRYR